jgi:hypothetical protein
MDRPNIHQGQRHQHGGGGGDEPHLLRMPVAMAAARQAGNANAGGGIPAAAGYRANGHGKPNNVSDASDNASITSCESNNSASDRQSNDNEDFEEDESPGPSEQDQDHQDFYDHDHQQQDRKRNSGQNYRMRSNNKEDQDPGGHERGDSSASTQRRSNNASEENSASAPADSTIGSSSSGQQQSQNQHAHQHSSNKKKRKHSSDQHLLSSKKCRKRGNTQPPSENSEGGSKYCLLGASRSAFEEEDGYLSELSSSDGMSTKNSSSVNATTSKGKGTAKGGKRKPLRKAPDPNATPKPKRPMSAYNFFFREERAKILVSEGRAHGTTGNESSQLGSSSKMTFENMGRMIAARWKAIDPVSLTRYTSMAEEDGVRYRGEMKRYYEKENERRRAILFPGMDARTDVNRNSCGGSTSISKKLSDATRSTGSNCKVGSVDDAKPSAGGNAVSRENSNANSNAFAWNNGEPVMGLSANLHPNPNYQQNCYPGQAPSFQGAHQNVNGNAQVQVQSLPQMQLMNLLGTMMMSTNANPSFSHQAQGQSQVQPLPVPSCGQVPNNQGGTGNAANLLAAFLRRQGQAQTPQASFLQQQQNLNVGNNGIGTQNANVLQPQLLQQLMFASQQQQEQQQATQNANANNNSSANLGALVLLNAIMQQGQGGGNQQLHQPQQVVNTPIAPQGQSILSGGQPPQIASMSMGMGNGLNNSGAGLSSNASTATGQGIFQFQGQQQQPAANVSNLMLPLALILQQQQQQNTQFQKR